MFEDLSLKFSVLKLKLASLIGFVWQVKSHAKAAAARASGRFKDEIIPVHTKVFCGMVFHNYCFLVRLRGALNQWVLCGLLDYLLW